MTSLPLFSGQFRYKRGVCRRGQALAKDPEQALAVTAQKRVGIQPQAGEDLGADDSRRVRRQRPELAPSPDEPEHLFLPQGSHEVLANSGFLIVSLFPM